VRKSAGIRIEKAGVIRRISEGIHMRVLLQKTRDWTYFQNAQSWVVDADEAQDFFTTKCALDNARILHLVDVQVVLKGPELGNTRSDAGIPVSDQRPPRKLNELSCGRPRPQFDRRGRLSDTDRRGRRSHLSIFMS
jgi:hypothetical protein